MSIFSSIREAVLHLFFPHVCAGCGNDVIATSEYLCLSCINGLPETGFTSVENNPVAKLFWGRLPLQHATACYYFTKASIMQSLLHQVKYKDYRELGIWLGTMMGQQIAASSSFRQLEGLIPLPLHKTRQKKRGYNQAELLCFGMASVLQLPVFNQCIIRKEATESQTKKNRMERWQNMQDRFELVNSTPIEGRHVLLVDDVITTGSTLEACARELCKASEIRLSLAALCFASRN